MKFGLMALAFAGVALVGLLPTCLYLYVEPRGRKLWAREGDNAATRRAPPLVRVTAWLSFVLGQLAIPWMLVPVACAVLLYLQAKLGIWKPIGMATTAAAGVAGILQSLLALRLLPLGVKLLMRDARACARTSPRARFFATANASVLAGALALGWVAHVPGLVNPWLRTALDWAALRPVMIYGAACVVHALLLGRCARAAET
jgi:hypothetical protein